MNLTLVQTKRQLDTLFCERLNEAVAQIGDNHDVHPNDLSQFFIDDEGVSYCRLRNGDRLNVGYDVSPVLVDGTIQVFVNLDHPQYGHHALRLLMDVPMLELYKDYLTQFIDEAITNEHHRVLRLSDQPGNNHKH